MAMLSGPKGLALSGRSLYVADTESHTIRRINLEHRHLATVLGAGCTRRWS
jgi:sugar lactone lactonase YvrE